jgi:putative hydrolase of the HAD superfamily
LVEARRHVVASAFAVLAGGGQPVPKAEVGNRMADLFTMLRDDELTVFPGAHKTLDQLNLDPAVGGCAEWPDRRIGPLWEQI